MNLVPSPVDHRKRVIRLIGSTALWPIGKGAVGNPSKWQATETTMTAIPSMFYYR